MEIRKLIVKLLLFGVIITSVYFFALWQVAQGQVDYFYPKFTHQAGSMIIGISRANDGISPAVIEQNFGENEIDYPVLNFAFANQISDYGPVYLNAIQKKLQPETKNGLFILGVTPGSLSILKSKPDSVRSISEGHSLLTTIKNFNKSPNFEYIRENYNHSLYKGFKRSRRIDIIRYTHSDGWQEVMMKSEHYVVSKEEVLKWKNMNVEDASNKVEYYKPSEARLLFLEKTINYLKDYGQVYLVRFPVCSEMLEIEQSFWPGFNTRMKKIAKQNQIVYFDYSGDEEQFNTYDGSHLFGASARDFTQQVCDDIKSLHK